MSGSELRGDERPAEGGREALWLGAVLVLAALLRTLAWQRNAALFDDGPLFIDIARAMAEGDWGNALLHPYHPLYPFATRLLAPIFGDFEAAAAAVSVLAGTAAVAALYVFVREGFGSRTALVAAALLSFHAEAVAVSSDVQSEGLYTALFLASLGCLWAGLRRGRLRLAAAAGALAGLAYLTRPEGLGVVLIGGASVVALVFRRAWRPRPAALFALALIAGAFVVSAPYVVALRVHTGEWQLTQKKSVVALARFSENTEVPLRGRIGRMPTLPRASDSQQAGPESGLGRTLAMFSELYVAAVPAFGYPTLLLLALGLWQCRPGRGGPKRAPGTGAFAAGTALFYGLVLCALAWSAGYVSRRHALPPLLPLLGYTAVGATVSGRWLLSSLPGGRGRRILAHAWAPALVGLCLAAAFDLPDDFSPRHLDRLAVRRAAEWLRHQELEPGGVAAGRPRVAYYAAEAFVPLPSGPKEGMLPYLRRHAARYVIVDESKLDQHLGLREAITEGLRVLHSEETAGHTAAVYEVVPIRGQRSGRESSQTQH